MPDTNEEDILDTVEDVFGPDSGNSIYNDLEELSVSRTKLATTTAQTIELAKALLDEHNTNPESHRNLSIDYAGPTQPGIVVIDENLNSARGEVFAVPNSEAVIEYVTNSIAGGVVYSGKLNIDSGVSNEIFTNLTDKVKKGSMFILSSDNNSHIDYNGHTYYSEDFVIANVDIKKSEDKNFNKFDWFNIQDRDVVKLNKTQYLTNKNLSDNSNIYRKARTELDGTVYIATDLNDNRHCAVVPPYMVKEAVNARLRSNDLQMNDSSWTFVPFNDDGTSDAYLNSKIIANLDSIRLYNSNKNLEREVYLPTNESNGATLNTTEFLVTKSYVDRSLSIFLDENKPVANPVIHNGKFTVYNHDGKTQNTSLSKTGNSITVEDGYKVTWSGTWKWTESENNSNPTQWSYNGFTSADVVIEANTKRDDVPPSGYPYGYTSDERPNGLNFYLGPIDKGAPTASFYTYSPQTGLIVNNGNIVVGNGTNKSSPASVTIRFNRNVYYGFYRGESLPNRTPEENYNLITGKDPNNIFKSGVYTTTATSLTNFEANKNNVYDGDVDDPEFDNWYFYLIYPESFGTIGVVRDPGKQVTDGFSKYPQENMTIKNSAGMDIEMAVYRFVNPGVYGPWTIENTIKQ